MRRIPFDLWTWLGGAFGLEGEPDAILVQRKVRMRYEYRVHMVAGRAVCGAGCIERFTPLDNHGERFDPRMEETRGNGRIESHPFIAQLYADHAEQVHKAIAGHVTGHYTIDLYLGDDGRPHVLELNDGANSGLYALHMDPLLEAIRDNPRMFTPPRPAGRLSELMEVES
nr:ATP-grasp domain-containing protein [Bifidobacterium felsineum]